MVVERPGSGPVATTVAWDLAKVLLVASTAALLVAAWFAFRPVENPDVQACGGPLLFVVGNTRDVVVPLGTPDAPVDAPRLRAQPPCSDLVRTELTRAGLFVSVGIALGLLGAVLGLLDDRLSYRRAPRFESLVRPRPADAPLRVFDPEPTTVDDLAARLAPVEPVVVGLLGFAAVLSGFGAAALVGVEALTAAIRDLGAGTLVLALLLAAAARIVAGVGRSATSATADAPGSPATWVRVASAADWAGHVRPEVTVAGVDLHVIAAGSTDVDHDAARVRGLVTMAFAVHVAVLGVALWVGAPDVAEPDGRSYLLLVGGVAILALIGMARLPRRARAIPLLPGRVGLSWLVANPAGAATSALSAVALLAAEVALVWVVVQGTGTSLALSTVVLAWVLAVSIGAASPFPSGALLTEATLALLLWRWGMTAPDALAAALMVRLVGFWLPMAVGRVQVSALDAARLARQTRQTPRSPEEPSP